MNDIEKYIISELKEHYNPNGTYTYVSLLDILPTMNKSQRLESINHLVELGCVEQQNPGSTFVRLTSKGYQQL